MDKKLNQESKKLWATPELKVHGTVEQMTQHDKQFGLDDGAPFTVMGNTIGS